MLKIYAIPVSIYCAKLRLVLRHKKLQWSEEPPVGGYKSPEFKKISPSGNLPTMVDGTLMLSDSEAIAEYLNERSPDPPMLVDDIMLRAKQRELGRFHDTRLEPELRVLFPLIPENNRDSEIAVAQGQAISVRLKQLGEIRAQIDHPDDAKISLGDCGFVVTFEWIEMLSTEMGFEVEWPEEIKGYRKWLHTIDVVKEEIAIYRPTMQDWLEQRVKQ